MPEIKNEVPSDEELLAYMNEWLDKSCFGLLTWYPENQHYYHPEVVEALSYLSASPALSDFLQTTRDTFFRSLKRLNKSPRDNPFWLNTNLRPTAFKLRSFCEQAVKDQPDDKLSLWTVVLLNLAHAGGFSPERWIRLYHLKAVNLDAVVFAAMFLEVAGSPSAEEFSVFVTATTTTAQATSMLRQIGANGGKLFARWSEAVVNTILTS